MPSHNHIRINTLIFWPQIGLYICKPYNMKALLLDLIASLTPKEKMPALVPVRVVKRVHPDQHR